MIVIYFKDNIIIFHRLLQFNFQLKVYLLKSSKIWSKSMTELLVKLTVTFVV